MTATAPLAPIDQAPQTLRDLVQDRMRSAILSGHFAPGARLVERPLCEQLGVSRTVIRETIRYLEAEGLVEILPNRGPIVATLHADQARQIYAIRAQLEGAAAAACAESVDETVGTRLSAALTALRGATLGEPAGLFAASTQFYEVIFDAAGHDVAWEIVQRLNGRISRLRALTLSATDRTTPGIAHMTAIHDAILRKDPAAARDAVTAHIADAAEIAARLLADEAKGDNDG